MATLGKVPLRGSVMGEARGYIGIRGLNKQVRTESPNLPLVRPGSAAVAVLSLELAEY